MSDENMTDENMTEEDLVEDDCQELELGIKELLKAFSDNPKVISDERFKELEVIFAKAMNMSPCPCGSETEYKFCCKTVWKFVERTFKESQKNSKDATKWIFRVGIGKDGLVLHTFNKNTQITEIFEIVNTVYNQTLVQYTTQLAMNQMIQMQRQAQTRQVAQADKGKSFRGL